MSETGQESAEGGVQAPAGSADLSPLDLLSSFIYAAGLSGVALLIADRFNPLAAAAAGLLGAALVFARYRRRISWTLSRQTAAASLLVLAAALIFRVPPYRYEIGGQDQGVYVNMSKHFADSGHLQFIDPVRERIRDDPELLEYYDRWSHDEWRLLGKFRFHVPGMFMSDPPSSLYTFQFYHMHPVWLSIFGALIGPEHRSWSCVFFGILSIWVLFLLLKSMSADTGGARVGARVGALPEALAGPLMLAVHPLHAYLSKLPLTEVPSLAFIVLGCWYLQRAVRQNDWAAGSQMLLLYSALSFFMFFLTRITGFMILPLFLVLYAGAKIGESSGQKQVLSHYAVLIIAFYTFSVFYGLLFSPHYARFAYEAFFNKAFIRGLSGIVLPALLGGVWAAIAVVEFFRLRIRAQWLQTICSSLLYFQPYICKLLLLIALCDAALQAWSRPVLLHANSSFVYYCYILPLALPLLFAPLARVEFRRTDVQFLSLALNLFIIIHLFLNPGGVPYQYYYARYMLSELIPLSIAYGAFCALLLLGKRPVVFAAFLLPALGYWIFFTAQQFRGPEGGGSHEAVEQIAGELGPDSVLLVVKKDFIFEQEVKLGLAVYHRKNLFFVPQAEDLQWAAARLRRRYRDILALGWETTNPENALLLRTVLYQQGTYGYWREIGPENFRTKYLPAAYRTLWQKYGLYRLPG